MSHSFAPFRENLEGIQTRTENGANVATEERVGSALLGGVLAVFGLGRQNLLGAALSVLGGFLIYRGVSGRCAAYTRLGIDTAGNLSGRGVPGNVGSKVESSIVIGRSPMELYYFWHDLANLSIIMPQLKSVTVDGLRSHWVVNGPAGHEVTWDAEFITEKPGDTIAWQTLPDAEVRNAGSVHFKPIGDGLTTQVTVVLEYLPPAGYAGRMIALLFGAAPEQQLDDALSKFKQYMEIRV